ncbi:g8847 [Coccomyxa viridis]|uniref:G8847 protein n=1 Tax=Coccomyxa viridis TaxID=1274662 RepID=A0ABP1G1E2_9CHLO
MNARKNECAYFCKECGVRMCQHCLTRHPQEHIIIQIRRYVYKDVVRVQDIHDHIDTTGIQTYINNSAKVVFLRERPHNNINKVESGSCVTCKRVLRRIGRCTDALGPVLHLQQD